MPASAPVIRTTGLLIWAIPLREGQSVGRRLGGSNMDRDRAMYRSPHPPVATRWVPPSPASGRGAFYLLPGIFQPLSRIAGEGGTVQTGYIGDMVDRRHG